MDTSSSEHPSTYFVQDLSNPHELLRLRAQDQLLNTMMGGVLSEQPEPLPFTHVLDVACGTGGWLVEMAQTYPSLQRLVGVAVTVHPLPLGKWEGRVGDLLAADLESVTANLKPFYQHYAHVSPKHFDDIMKQLRPEWEIYHTSYEFYSIIGQKLIVS